MRGRALLADEVGLGKTIEAGIVMKELIERGLVHSVLVLVPAPLVWQWHEELVSKFHEQFVVLEKLEQLPPNPPTDDNEITRVPYCRWIISLDRAKTARWSERLLAREYDLLIVDEAHKLKNHRTLAYRFVNSIRKRFVLMLTATPVHNNLMELYNLVTILRPGHLGTRRAFRRNFVTSGPLRRVITWSTRAPTGLKSYVKSTSPGRLPRYLGYRVETSEGQFELASLVSPPIATDPHDLARLATPVDLSKFERAKATIAGLLQQGYQVDRSWVVKHRKGSTYGFRVELSQQREEQAGDSQRSRPPAQRRPGRRTVYSTDYIPSSYLRKSREKRQAYRQAEPQWILRHTETLSDLDKLKNLDWRGQAAVEEVKDLLAQGYEVIEFEAIEWRNWIGRRRTDFVCRLKLKTQPRSPSRSRGSHSQRRTKPRNPDALRGLLRGIMIRNRRSSVGVRFPPRRAAVYFLNLTPPERELYDGVTRHIREQLQNISHSDERRQAGRMRLALMTLQKELCSSPQAVARTLEKLIARQTDKHLVDYLSLARSIEQGRKVAATKIILEQYPGKFLIFTEYLPTLHTLCAALEEAGHKAILFHGGMSSHERIEAVRDFRKSARVMISTQSGGEGHNLQFCHQMINYDLPWNPMRIEQRIGRIHRLGQKHEVVIFNLSASHTIEAYVLDLLARKIRMFELVIGELDLILGELDDRRGFEAYLQAAWAGSRSEAELLQRIAELEALIDRAREGYEQIKGASGDLSELINE
jgi:superfamily II DNA or RNA helicase